MIPTEQKQAPSLIMAMRETTKEAMVRSAFVVLYLLIGAAVFYGLEKTEVKSPENQEAYLARLRANLSVNISTKELNWLVDRIREDINREKDSANTELTFYTSFCLCASVVTTTGFGHLAPLTNPGRMFALIYGVVGIPLTLLALKSVGERTKQLIGDLITLISRKVQKRRPRQKAVKVMVCAILLVICTLLIGGPLYLSEGWTYSQCVYYCFIALTTIGFDDMVPRDGRAPATSLQTLEVIIRGCYVAFGLSVVSTFLISLMCAADELKCTCHLIRNKGGFRQEALPEDYMPEEGPGGGPRFDGLYSVSRGVDQIVFPSVIPFRRFTSDESMPLTGDPRWFY